MLTNGAFTFYNYIGGDNVKTDRLSKHLELISREYAENHSALDFYAYEDKAFKYCALKYRKIKTEFVYSLSGSANYPVSTLSCRVYLSPESPYFFEIQELIDYLDIYDYHCYSFPYVESNKRLEACFSYITDFLEYREEEILSLCGKEEELIEEKLKEIKRIYGYDETGAPHDRAGKDSFYSGIFKHYSDFIVPRYTSEKAYIDFVCGKYKASLNNYKKIEKKTGYERKLIKFIEGQFAPYQAVPDECASIIEVRKYMHADVKTFVLTTVLSVLIFCLAFLLLQLLINLVYSLTTRFADCANPFISALCGVIPGVIGAIVLRKRIEPFVMRNKKEALDFYDLLGSADNSRNGLICEALALGLCFLVFLGICRPQIAVYENKIKVNKNNSVFINYEKYKPEDIEEVIYVEGYYTDETCSEFIEKPFYAYVTYTRDYFTSENFTLNEEQEKELIRVLSPRQDGYELKTAHTTRNIH